MQSPDREFGATAFRAFVSFTEDALYTTSVDDTITFWNPGAERLFGFTADEAIGADLATLLRASTDDEQRLTHAAATGESIRDVDAVRCHRDGRRIPIALSVVPLTDAGGSIVGTLRIARDVSSRLRAERAARRLAAIVESSDDAILSKDLNGIVMSWNAAAERMFGYTAEEMIGESIRNVIPADRQAEEDEVLARLRRGEKVSHFETLRQRRDGKLIPISLTISPVLDEDGRVIGASTIARDISDQRAAESERARLLALAEENVAIAQHLSRVGEAVASGLDRDKILQSVTDIATQLTLAEFGAFDPTFHGSSIVRRDDAVADPPEARDAPERSLLSTHRAVRSYLAVPVKSRSGDVLGGLFFGHSRSGVFTEAHERLATGVASWAAVTLENARLYAEAQEASRLKDEFLATLSHELRTPLNAILGYSRMIRSGIVLPENHAKAIGAVERNAASLAQIVEDVLDVSRIISGKLRLNMEPTDFGDVVRHAVDAVKPAADAKSIRLEAHVNSRAQEVSADSERLQQVIWNILSNAVKFTPRNGRVDVSLASFGDTVELVVRDTGIGIRKDFLPHIFERFRQQDSSTTRERGGLGLGLGIARQLVEMHGGTIEAESGGPGAGATFRVTLPALRRRKAQEPAEHLREPPALAPLCELKGVRVLVVDDDPDALAMVREILEAAGADVAVAPSATDALNVVDSVRPDVLVADLGMPRVDGFELIARVRTAPNDATRRVPAAALTAYARSDDRLKALRSGFQMHLAKPIDPAELTAAVAELAHRSD
jgi:PAS domain S-box-containing protein